MLEEEKHQPEIFYELFTKGALLESHTKISFWV